MSIEHVRSHTGIRGNEAADALARSGTQIGDRERTVERGGEERGASVRD